MALEPGLDLRVLMRGVVVLDQMDAEVLGRLAIDLLEEPQPFDMRVARLGACNQFALQRAERCDQCDRAVAFVIVRHRTRPLRRERQPELGRSRAWHWLFSSQHNTSAFAGGSR